MDMPRNASDISGQNPSAHTLRLLVDQMDGYLRTAADTGDQKFNEARSRLSEQVQQMKAQLDDFNDEAMARLKRAARQADEQVKAHPYGAMGSAAALGLLVGYLAARR
jgi:ElaB protein